MLCPRCDREIPDDAVLCCYCARSIVRRQQPKRHARGNGQGTAYRRGKTWTACVTVGWEIGENDARSQKRLYKGGFKTRAEALEYIPALRDGGVAKSAPVLDHYWLLYRDGEYQKLSDSKQTAYKIAWEKLKSLRLRAVNSLTVSDLRRVVNEKAHTYYPARDMKQLLKHLFALADADGWVNARLPDYITLPDLNERERKPFTEAEQAALWKLYDGGDRRAALPLIMIYTGMMPGEMQGLKLDMIDIDNQCITGAGLKTKVRRAAPIYLPDTIIPVLIDEMQRAASKSGYVWSRNEDRFYKDYYAALEAAGCRRLEPYCCRHTTATSLAISEGIAPQTIKKIMRWSTTKMLDKYAHPDDADAKQALNRLKRLDPQAEQSNPDPSKAE